MSAATWHRDDVLDLHLPPETRAVVSTGRKRMHRSQQRVEVVLVGPERGTDEALLWRLTAVARRLAVLACLGKGWDGRDARPVTPDAAGTALRVAVDSLSDSDIPVPAIVPSVEGGLLIEWHRQGIELDVDVSPDGTAWVSFEDLETGEEWQGPWPSKQGSVRDELRRRLAPESRQSH